jgi:hypothetical protein
MVVVPVAYVLVDDLGRIGSRVRARLRALGSRPHPSLDRSSGDV